MTTTKLCGVLFAAAFSVGLGGAMGVATERNLDSLVGAVLKAVFR
jgi:hypothetical protein